MQRAKFLVHSDIHLNLTSTCNFKELWFSLKKCHGYVTSGSIFFSVFSTIFMTKILYISIEISLIIGQNWLCFCVESLYFKTLPKSVIIKIYGTMCHYTRMNWIILTTVQCHYKAVSFIQNLLNRHPIAHPYGQGKGCLLWVWSLIYILLLSSQCCRLHWDELGCAITALNCTMIVVYPLMCRT